MSSLVRRLQPVWQYSARFLPTLLGVVLLNFLLLQLVPGDAADVLAGQLGSATAETMVLLRHHLGVDIPVGQQLLNYLSNLAHFNLGFSPRYNMPVLEVILTRLPATLLLMLTAFTLAFGGGVLIGVVSAVWRNRWPDRLLSLLVTLLYSTPAFWLGIVLVILFSVTLSWLPSDGNQTIGVALDGWQSLLDSARHLVLPALALSSHFLAIYARLTRAAMIEMAGEDFVRTARAKGVHPFFVTVRHVLRNALLPVTTVAGVHLGNLLGGAATVEMVFSWPGLGRLALESVEARDFTMLLGILLLSSFLVVAINILVDLLHHRLDPRTRTSGTAVAE